MVALVLNIVRVVAELAIPAAAALSAAGYGIYRLVRRKRSTAVDKSGDNLGGRG